MDAYRTLNEREGKGEREGEDEREDEVHLERLCYVGITSSEKDIQTPQAKVMKKDLGDLSGCMRSH